MRQLLTLLLSLLLCATCMAQPDSRPGPYQATLAKINALLIGGAVAWDANYIYVCTATNTWKRAALTGGY